MATDKINDGNILISIVIVNYKVPYCLAEALHSLRIAKLYDRCEIIIIDNASGDNSREFIVSKFQEVRWIQLKTNIGFGKACNIGAAAACGKYLLLLNPDTVISESTLSSAVEFMEAHPNAGLMGPKILNPDGTLQLSCRRSIPTPIVAFYYFSGLSYLFPKSKRFGRYHLTYMNEDEAAQVEVISGSFMFMTRDLFNAIGGFDKRFFMYGEDIDLCYRISRGGYEVWYYPDIKIVHQKGKSSSKRRIRSRIYFYEAMIIFSRKYRGQQDAFFPWWLMWAGIVFQAALNIGAIIARSVAALTVDLVVINAALWAAVGPLLSAYFGTESLYASEPILSMAATHAAISFAFATMFLYNGIYSARLYTVGNILFSGILGFAVVISGIYFLTDYKITGFIAALAAAEAAVIIWREALPLFIRGLRGRIFAPETAIIVGHSDDIIRYVHGIDRRQKLRIAGIVSIERSESAGQVEGYPILGGINDLDKTISDAKADVLVIAAAKPWYSDIIDILAQYKNRDIDIRWEAMK